MKKHQTKTLRHQGKAEPTMRAEEISHLEAVDKKPPERGSRPFHHQIPGEFKG